MAPAEERVLQTFGQWLSIVLSCLKFVLFLFFMVGILHLLFWITIAFGTWLHFQTPLSWPIVTYLVSSVLTYILFYADKRAAKKKAFRASEAFLLGGCLLGGWPGGYVASRVFRHKTQKWIFRIQFWIILILHAALWSLWFQFYGCKIMSTRACEFLPLSQKTLGLLWHYLS